MKLHEFQALENVNSRSKSKDFSRACRDKQKFFSKADAQKAIDSGNMRAPEHLEAYKCSFCSSWHVGHSRAYYRQLRKMPEKPVVSDRQRNVYIRHIKRLQEQNRILAEALAEERITRQKAYAWYQKRLRSWWWRTIDMMLVIIQRDRSLDDLP